MKGEEKIGNTTTFNSRQSLAHGQACCIQGDEDGVFFVRAVR